MPQYPATIYVEVTPISAGWTIELWWAPPDNPENFQFLGSETTDANGVATFNFTFFVSQEYQPVIIYARAPQQVHPVTGELYSEAETEPKNVYGYTEPTWHLNLVPFGSMVLITLQGMATAGFPLPNLTLEILVDGDVYSTQTFPSVNLGVLQELSAVFDIAGSHTAQGKMYIYNVAGSFELSTSVVPFVIPI